jgi:hypothetical protein
MKTIKEHNKLIWDMHNKPIRCGIECPECKKEMVYADNVILTSLPPQRRISCECGYSTTVYC